MSSASTLKFFRQTHRYIGIFIAPSLLFFALTGALQTFSLHETTAGSSYKPPSWIVMLAQIHKKQTDVVTAKKPKPAEAASAIAKSKAAAPVPAVAAPPQKSHLPLKIFFLFVAVGLFTSTLTGIYMSYRYGGSKLVVTLLLLAGIVIPLLAMPF